MSSGPHGPIFISVASDLIEFVQFTDGLLGFPTQIKIMYSRLRFTKASRL